ncbi:unnamed protein product [Chironomus riparius]|uniref:Single domain-containing protein n=1 Tax=Chironomus riparius TaxID=315576 RepID=A0A9N9S722_9DIPT|nr:unnamed protein product [Chironomus riparius]
MKISNFLVLIVFLIIIDFANSVGFVHDAKIEDCSTGQCIEMCQYDNLKLLPDTEEVNDGKCRRVKCNSDFSVVIKYCSPTTNDKCKKLKDGTKKIPFPYCCDVCRYNS